jgi:hypothetical protein
MHVKPSAWEAMMRAPPERRRPLPPESENGPRRDKENAGPTNSATSPAEQAAHGCCDVCGTTIVQASKGRLRKFCGSKCRQKSYRNAVLGNRPRDRLSPLQPLSNAPSCGSRTLPEPRSEFANPIDLVGGHHRGSLDLRLRRVIVAAEIGGATSPGPHAGASDEAR